MYDMPNRFSDAPDWWLASEYYGGGCAVEGSNMRTVWSLELYSEASRDASYSEFDSVWDETRLTRERFAGQSPPSPLAHVEWLRVCLVCFGYACSTRCISGSGATKAGRSTGPTALQLHHTPLLSRREFHTKESTSAYKGVGCAAIQVAFLPLPLPSSPAPADYIIVDRPSF